MQPRAPHDSHDHASPPHTGALPRPRPEGLRVPELDGDTRVYAPQTNKAHGTKPAAAAPPFRNPLRLDFFEFPDFSFAKYVTRSSF